MNVLLQNGADVQSMNNRGWTALGEASYTGHTPLMLQIICSGAEIKARGHNS